MADRWLASRLIERPRWHVPVERRACTRHPELAATDRCDRCGQPFCAGCLTQLERWRVCAPCLGQLRRERQGAPLGTRWGGVWRDVAAVLAFGALMVAIVVLISRGLGGAGSDAALGATAHAIGPKALRAQQMGAAPPVPASLQLQVPLGSGSPPAQIVLSGAGFRAGEQVRLTGTLSGQMGAGHVASVALALAHPSPGGEVRATSAGDLVTVTLAVPNSSRFFGRYHVQVRAVGDAGSSARFDATAGGMPADGS
jgi:hypothetical protein